MIYVGGLIVSPTYPSNYKQRKDTFDNRIFRIGQIWKVRDILVRLLPSDRMDNSRKIHPCRPVVIIQNCDYNIDAVIPYIQIAPLTTKIKYATKYDIIVRPEDDQVNEESMIQMPLGQPILKKDLFMREGEISKDKIMEIIDVQLKMVGVDLEQIQKEMRQGL